MLTTILAMLLTVLVVCLLLGVCIFVHEFGHLLAALACGLHVERFSLGFGRRLWGWHVRGVEYVISLLPFGGYVALPQLEPTDKPVDRNGTPLPVAKPWQRMLTALAGPLANIAFGFALALIVCWVSTYRPAPMDRYVVHSVEDGCPEQAAGLRPDDAIVKVNEIGRAHV